MMATGNITIRTLAGAEFSMHASFDMGFYGFISSFLMDAYLSVQFTHLTRKS